MQEALRKDVKQAFGVLQACFSIVAQPERGWSSKKLNQIMIMCIILHNMIVEDERGSLHKFEYDGCSAMVEPSKTNRSISCSLSRTIKGYKMLHPIIN
jgi:hypothetical protein